jgi:hypothetical protein
MIRVQFSGRVGNSMRNVLRNKQWRRMESMLLGKITDSGRTDADNHLFVEAALWIARTGRAVA